MFPVQSQTIIAFRAIIHSSGPPMFRQHLACGDETIGDLHRIYINNRHRYWQIIYNPEREGNFIGRRWQADAAPWFPPWLIFTLSSLSLFCVMRQSAALISYTVIYCRSIAPILIYPASQHLIRALACDWPPTIARAIPSCP